MGSSRPPDERSWSGRTGSRSRRRLLGRAPRSQGLRARVSQAGAHRARRSFQSKRHSDRRLRADDKQPPLGPSTRKRAAPGSHDRFGQGLGRERLADHHGRSLDSHEESRPRTTSITRGGAQWRRPRARPITAPTGCARPRYAPKLAPAESDFQTPPRRAVHGLRASACAVPLVAVSVTHQSPSIAARIIVQQRLVRVVDLREAPAGKKADGLALSLGKNGS